MEIEFTTEIDRPVEEVFAYLTDPTNVSEWDPRVVVVEQETEGPLTRGTRLRETRRVLGRELEQVVEVSEWEPPRRFSLRIVSGPLPINGHNLLEAVDGRTRLRFRAEGTLRGPMRLAAPFVRRLVGRQMRSHYERIRRNLEAR